MRIIGGRDYYDSFIQYGVDNNIILNRNNQIKYDINILSDKIDKIYKIKEDTVYIKDIKKENIFNISNRRNVFNNTHICSGYINVIIGENEYKGLILDIDYTKNYSYNQERHYIWNINSFNKHLNEFGYSHTIKPKNYYTSSFSEDAFDVKKVHPSVTDFMIANEISIIVVSKAFHCRTLSWQFNESILNEIEFYRKLDGHEVYQNLSHWIGNILLPSKQMPDITDDKIKLHKHGFDKWSFRKMSIKDNI